MTESSEQKTRRANVFTGVFANVLTDACTGGAR
jgi:hypothetical protein